LLRFLSAAPPAAPSLAPLYRAARRSRNVAA
jgi:hypothetical protein